MKLFNKNREVGRHYRKKSTKSILSLCMILIFAACLTIGGTLAYLQAHAGTVSNTFKAGEITYTLNLKANAELVNHQNNEVTMPTELTAQKSTALSVAFGPDKDPVLTGYNFEGWYYDSTCLDENLHTAKDIEEIIVQYGDRHDTHEYPNNVEITLYAKWTPNTYTVVYDKNGDDAAGITGSTENSIHTYDAAKNLTTNGFSRIGYTFAGWNTERNGSGDNYADGQSVVNLTAENNDEVTLYAQWTPITYTVKYHNNVDPDDTSVTQPTGSTADSTHTYDEAKSLTENGFKRTGYTFIGWNTEPDGRGDYYANGQSVVNLTSEPDGVVTLYAQWGVKSYTIRYHANGADNTMADQTIKYDVPTALSLNEFVMNDYSFGGWALSPDGKTASYIDGQIVVNLLESGTLDLYAIWIQDSHTLTFDYNGGTGSPASKQVLNGEKYGQLPEYPVHPTEKESDNKVMTYLFTGWYTEKVGGVRVYPEEIVNRTDDHTLYAHWEEAPSNNVIQNMVVKNNPDDNKDGVADDLYLEFTCTSSFEKYNIPLNDLVPGQKYKLTYTASNDASFGDYISGYQNSVYGSYILAESALTGGRIENNYTSDKYVAQVLADWNSRREPDGVNDGSQAATNDSLLQGPWKNKEIVFTATNTTMYWTWDFGLMQDNIQNNYNMTDIVLEPVLPEIKFAEKDLATSNGAKFVDKHNCASAISFEFDGEGGCETLYIPITGLTAGTTYTIGFDHIFNGKFVSSVGAYDHGCGIMATKPTTGTAYMDDLGTWISNKYVMPLSSTNTTNHSELTFTATSDTAYWVWNMANCSDSSNCNIGIRVTDFRAAHKNGGSITYNIEPCFATLDLIPEEEQNEIIFDWSGIDDTNMDIWYPVDEQYPTAGDSYELAFELLEGYTMAEIITVTIDDMVYDVYTDGRTEEGIIAPFYDAENNILNIPAELLTEETVYVSVSASALPLEDDELTEEEQEGDSEEPSDDENVPGMEEDSDENGDANQNGNPDEDVPGMKEDSDENGDANQNGNPDEDVPGMKEDNDENGDNTEGQPSDGSGGNDEPGDNVPGSTSENSSAPSVDAVLSSEEE